MASMRCCRGRAGTVPHSSPVDYDVSQTDLLVTRINVSAMSRHGDASLTRITNVRQWRNA